MHRVLCFGGRTYSDRAAVDAALSFLVAHLGGPFVIIQGGARGADALCKEWGRRLGYCVVQVDADWQNYDRAAGGICNGWMLEHCRPTYAVGFPGGPGSADMARRLKAANVPTWFPEG